LAVGGFCSGITKTFKSKANYGILFP